MDNRTTIRILLGEWRGYNKTGGLRSYNIFNNGIRDREGRDPVNGLLALNEDYLEPDSSIRIDIAEPTGFALVPIAGGLEILTTGFESPRYVSPGQTAVLGCMPNTSLTVANPYPRQTVHFLRFRLPHPFKQGEQTQAQVFDPSLRNRCQPLFDCPRIATLGVIALMDLRMEAGYVCNNPSATVVAYAVQGAFECQDRLLHPKDALVLEGLETQVEFEALSSDAILVLVETRAI